MGSLLESNLPITIRDGINALSYYNGAYYYRKECVAENTAVYNGSETENKIISITDVYMDLDTGKVYSDTERGKINALMTVDLGCDKDTATSTRLIPLQIPSINELFKKITSEKRMSWSSELSGVSILDSFVSPDKTRTVIDNIPSDILKEIAMKYPIGMLLDYFLYISDYKTADDILNERFNQMRDGLKHFVFSGVYTVSTMRSPISGYLLINQFIPFSYYADLNNVYSDSYKQYVARFITRVIKEMLTIPDLTGRGLTWIYNFYFAVSMIPGIIKYIPRDLFKTIVNHRLFNGQVKDLNIYKVLDLALSKANYKKTAILNNNNNPKYQYRVPNYSLYFGHDCNFNITCSSELVDIELFMASGGEIVPNFITNVIDMINPENFAKTLISSKQFISGIIKDRFTNFNDKWIGGSTLKELITIKNSVGDDKFNEYCNTLQKMYLFDKSQFEITRYMKTAIKLLNKLKIPIEEGEDIMLIKTDNTSPVKLKLGYLQSVHS